MSLTSFGQVIRLSSMILFAFFSPDHLIKENALLRRESPPVFPDLQASSPRMSFKAIKKTRDKPRTEKEYNAKERARGLELLRLSRILQA
jgi:hypothetical protein